MIMTKYDYGVLPFFEYRDIRKNKLKSKYQLYDIPIWKQLKKLEEGYKDIGKVFYMECTEYKPNNKMPSTGFTMKSLIWNRKSGLQIKKDHLSKRIKEMIFNEYLKEEKMQITKEMEDWYYKRTKKHIDLVKKYCNKIYNYNDDEKILDRGGSHDQSKYKEPEKTPYILISWYYKCKNDGIKFEYNGDMDKASHHHITNNRHHPEFHCGDKTELLNKDDRDGIPDKIIDATKMTDLDIAEMVADWCAMSEEKGTNTPKEWADKVVNKRWKFTDKQKDLIYDLIDKIWDN